MALDRLGRKSEADRELAAALQNYAGEQACWIAYFYASRNDPDRAFAWLDRAYRQHEWPLHFIDVRPAFKKFEADPRYKAFLRKMKLPE